MDKRIQIEEEALENVAGGQITYTWNGTSGTIGIGGDNRYILVDKAAFVAYYNSVKDEGLKDSQILKNLLAKGIAKKQ